MIPKDFIGYIGDRDIHDGTVEGITEQGDRVLVHIEGAGGRPLAVEFLNVESVKQQSAVGMMLYALVEWWAPAPWRRFVFANWDDEDDAFLEIIAQDWRMVTPPQEVSADENSTQ